MAQSAEAVRASMLLSQVVEQRVPGNEGEYVSPARSRVFIDEAKGLSDNDLEGGRMTWNRRTADSAMRGPSRCYVVVTIGARLFAVDAHSFKGELIAEEAPDTVVSIDGTIYPALALADRLEVAPNVDSVDRRVILLAHQDRCGCIGVDRVHGQVAYQMSEVVPLPLHFRGIEREWYQGLILFQNSVAVILNLSSVLRENQSDPGTRLPDGSEDSSYGLGTDPSEVMAKVQKC